MEADEISISSDDPFISKDILNNRLSTEMQRRAISMAHGDINTMRTFSYIQFADFLLIATMVVTSYILLRTGRSVVSGPYMSAPLDLSPHLLPKYAMQSILRMILAYIFSLVFSLGYAYTAYCIPLAAKLLMIIIDVLQSIPLLSFVPSVVTGLIAVFPGARIGVELAAMLLLFTSMAWNLVLGFYQSLLGIPKELREASDMLQLSAWKRFWTLELPAGCISLIWNSIMSVAGGWFFLISIESFELGSQSYRLPGLGSYLALAAENANYKALCFGLLTVISIIVATDILLWRPLIAWSTKFQFSSGRLHDNQAGRSWSPLGMLMQRSQFIRVLGSKYGVPLWNNFTNLDIIIARRLKRWRDSQQERVRDAVEESLRASEDYMRSLSTTQVSKLNPALGPDDFDVEERQISDAVQETPRFAKQAPSRSKNDIFTFVKDPRFKQAVFSLVRYAVIVGLSICLLYSSWMSILILRKLSLSAWIEIFTGSLFTLARVCAALLLSLLWTVPLGVAIGRDSELAAKVQPIVQVAASVPATALFPFVLLALANVGGGLQIGSILLMMLGTCWFVLFNCIAGTQAIPPEFFEADAVFGRNNMWIRWRTLILPGIFPYLITGIITAVGGAWNSAIIAEYVRFQGGTLKTLGLGAIISSAAASGDIAMLLAGTLSMSLLVLLTNRFVWAPLTQLAKEKYSIN